MIRVTHEKRAAGRQTSCGALFFLLLALPARADVSADAREIVLEPGADAAAILWRATRGVSPGALPELRWEADRAILKLGSLRLVFRWIPGAPPALQSNSIHLMNVVLHRARLYLRAGGDPESIRALYVRLSVLLHADPDRVAR